MAANLLQVNFKLKVSPEEYDRTASSLGQAFADVDGLAWKIWLLNREEREAGGIYLFSDDAAVDAFLQGPLAAQVKAAPFLTELSVKRFSVMQDVTDVTRGPVNARVGV